MSSRPVPLSLQIAAVRAEAAVAASYARAAAGSRAERQALASRDALLAAVATLEAAEASRDTAAVYRKYAQRTLGLTP